MKRERREGEASGAPFHPETPRSTLRGEGTARSRCRGKLVALFQVKRAEKCSVPPERAREARKMEGGSVVVG